jgi:hypothetical protein
LRTLVPDRYSRGASPQDAAADSALGSRSTPGSSARTVVAVWRPTVERDYDKMIREEAKAGE